MFPGSQHYKGVEGCARAPGWDQKELTSFNYSHRLAQNQHKMVVHSWNIFGVKTNHRQLGHTRLITARTWGKPPPSPLYYTLQFFMVATSKWLFVLGLPNGSPEIPIVGTLAILRAHNFLCISLIVMRFEEKLQPSSRCFQRCVACWLHARKLGRFLTFNDWESNYQFDSQPFFWP